LSGRNRSTFDIAAEILRELREPTGVTNTISNCNMSFKQSGYYLSFMKSSDIIQTDAITGRVKYCRTEAGQKFLETYDKMILLLDPGFFPALPNVTTSTRCNTMVGWGKVLSPNPNPHT
jgi:predicted transcriptional regulator